MKRPHSKALRFNVKKYAFLASITINVCLVFTLTLFLPGYGTWKLHSLSSMHTLTERTNQIENGPVSKYREEQRSRNYFHVYEDFLPPASLHSEGASCRIGSKLYLIGGTNYTIRHDIHGNIEAHLGSQAVTIYDMKDMSVSFGPRLPYRANHVTCAETSDGHLHVTGGFRQDAPEGQIKAYDAHYVWNTSSTIAHWIPRANLPSARGAHGCVFLKDGKMYCVGGAPDQWGPFLADLIVYDPLLDNWYEGPSMHTARDHVAATDMKAGGKIYVVGGRTHSRRAVELHVRPWYWIQADTAEVYDLDTRNWSLMRKPLSSRAAVDVIAYKRRQDENAEPNLLLIGGESFAYMSGWAHNLIEEYDVDRDLYYCHHQRLPHPYYGGAMGEYEGKLHIVGGAETFGISATRRIQVYDIAAAPPPEPCFYDMIPVFDRWRSMPYPGINLVDRYINVTLTQHVWEETSTSKP